jgi:hypothetical protein
MKAFGKLGMGLRRERTPTKQEAKVLLALLDQSENWAHGYKLHKRYGIAPATVYGWIDDYVQRGYLDEAPYVPGESRHPVRLNKEGITFAKRRLKDFEAEEVYKHGERAKSGST